MWKKKAFYKSYVIGTYHVLLQNYCSKDSLRLRNEKGI